MIAHSYSRISTAIQIDGHGLKRQKGQVEDYCLRKGLRLAPEPLKDIASGYHGQHLKNGALGFFLEKVERGDIKTPCALVIEALDRLSRQKPMRSMRLLWDIVESGVEVHTTMNERIYTAKMGMAEMMDSMFSLFTGHEESEKKSKRHKANWNAKRANAREKIITKTCPCWLTPKSDKTGFVVNTARANVIREIFEMTAQGMGKTKVVDHLNNSGVKPFSTAKRWHASYIQKLMANENVMGHLKTTCRVDGKPTPGEIIENYYPCIITREQWDAAHGSRAARTPQYNRYDQSVPQDMIRGIFFLNGLPGRWRNAGKRWGQESEWSISYRTFSPITGKRIDSVNRKSIELQLLCEVIELDPAALIPTPTADSTTGQITELKAAIAEHQAAIDRLVDALADGTQSTNIRKRITTLEASKGRSEEKLRKLTSDSTEKAALARKLPVALEAIQHIDRNDINERIISNSDPELRQSASRHLHELLERLDYCIGYDNFPPHLKSAYRNTDPSKTTHTLTREDYTAFAFIIKFRTGAVIERVNFYSPRETAEEVSGS